VCLINQCKGTKSKSETRNPRNRTKDTGQIHPYMEDHKKEETLGIKYTNANNLTCQTWEYQD